MKRKTALITGASRGIGRAAAIKLAREGYDIAACCLKSAEQIEDLKFQLETVYGVRVLTFLGDVGDFEFVKDMFHDINMEFGGADVVVNNAGISYIGLLSEMDPDEWNRVINTNLTAVFYCSKLAIPHMLSVHEGKIINISSVWGVAGASCEVAYSASKGGINAFTQALAKELAPSNIQVNAIACGAIDTEMNQFLSEDERQCLIDEIPGCRLGKAEEVADLIWTLAGGHNYLTGQIIRLDGGWI